MNDLDTGQKQQGEYGGDQAGGGEVDVKPFLEHLEELRWVVLKSSAAIVIGSIICFSFAGKIVGFLKRPLVMAASEFPETEEMAENVLRSLKPTEAFVISLKAALVCGLILGSPLVFHYCWGFLSPGLTRKERRAVLPVFVGGGVFFLAGTAVCYFFVLKICLLFFWNYTLRMAAVPTWTIGGYMSFVATLLIAFGVAFEMPVVAAVLGRLGLLTGKTLAEKRLYAIVGIFVFAAILTPPDVISQIMLAVPMLGLYELSIVAAKVMEKKARA